MGGDDLDSEDEYLAVTDLPEPGSSASPYSMEEEAASTGKSKNKRDQDDSGDEIVIDSKKRRRKEKNTENTKEKVVATKSPQQLLLQTSRTVVTQPAEVQASFVWASLTHTLGLTGDFKEEDSTMPKLEAKHFYVPSRKNVGIVEQLRSAPMLSVKKLKRWKQPKSPMVIVVCSSARRAVELLKDLAPLHVKTAKLFPKQGSIEEQAKSLAEDNFGLVVGTPNRLIQLIMSQHLELDHTQLMVLDAALDKKSFTVCTLRDTAADCMRLVQTVATYQMTRRDTIRFAFL
jgi:hypothetical protein